MDSILETIKKMLGLAPDYTAFDVDVMVLINDAFSTLNQIGVGPITTFSISDSTSKWSDFLGEDTGLEEVKKYIYLKVRLVFDPPTSATVSESYSRMIQETEVRMNMKKDIS